jgi:hypothetical protein
VFKSRKNAGLVSNGKTELREPKDVEYEKPGIQMGIETTK